MKPTFIPQHFFGGSWVALGAVAFMCVSATVLRGATPAATGALPGCSGCSHQEFCDTAAGCRCPC